MSGDTKTETKALIEEAADRFGFSKAGLAHAIGVSRATIHRAANGDFEMRARSLDNLRALVRNGAATYVGDAIESPGERLRQRRQGLGLSARELAEKLDLSESAVRNQENGTNGFSALTAQRYAEVLGVTPDWLLFGEGGGGGKPSPRKPPYVAQPPVQMTGLGNGKARLEMNVVVPMGVALKVLAFIHDEQGEYPMSGARDDA